MNRTSDSKESRVALPPQRHDGPLSLEATLRGRRSQRSFTSEPLEMAELGQLAWAAQGVTGRQGQRTAPSGGGRYPLDLFVVASRVEGLAPGVYRYNPGEHRLERHARAPGGDRGRALAEAALGQRWVHEAQTVFVLTATYDRITSRYGERGRRYAVLEAGHAAQNLHLQAVALELGSVPVGAFDDQAVKRALGLADDEEPLYLLPVGAID